VADNVPITAGSGTTIATEDESGVHYQKIKMVAGASGTTVPIGHAEDDAHVSGDGGISLLAVRKDAAVALAGSDGDYTPLITDSQDRLWVRPAPVQVRIQPSITADTSAYTSGDSLCGLVTITGAARESGGSGIIQSIILLDKTQAQRAAMDILFFDRSVTVAAANAALAMSDADMVFCLGIVPIGPYNTAWAGTPLNSVATLLNVGIPFVCSGTANLYAAICVRGTPTYAASDIVLSIGILQD
jgi:hypothetical protein